MYQARRRRRLHRSDQAGVFAAIAGVSMTFQRTLMPRKGADQAIVTGATMGVMYLAASLIHDAIETGASRALTGKSQREAGEDSVRRLSMAGDVASAIAGLALQRALAQKEGEPLRRSAARTTAWWVCASSLAGLASGVTEELIDTLDDRTDHRFGIDRLPIALVGGGAFAAVREYQRRRREAGEGFVPQEKASVAGLRALGMGAGIGSALVGMSLGNRALSRALGSTLGGVFPGGERLWRPAAHLTNFAILGLALYYLWDRVCRQIEAGTGKIEPAFDSPPVGQLVSGSTASLIPWETLGREGRRHVGTVLPKHMIEGVMDDAAVNPIRVFVGLESAPTETERVELAIGELERLGAFERSILLVTSPTGTGYVNYVAVESLEYLTRGNCATVTIQYSKRPSPMSLDRVWEGRKQFRMLLAAIHRRLYDMPPEKRPRLVVFGESLGAHTSQDAFVNAGTQGLRDAGVERGLWIGTPHLSKWKTQVQGRARPDVDRKIVGEFAGFDEVEQLPRAKRKALRYFLVTHANDGVARFGPDLLVQKPDWLGDPSTRPAGVPQSERWVSPTSFFQTLIDMNNSMSVVAGDFVANGHDYRADLARFVREAYGLKCSPAQMDRIEQALRRYELYRAQLFERAAEAAATTGKKTNGHVQVAQTPEPG